MQLTKILFCAVLFCMVYSLPSRKYPENKHDHHDADKEIDNNYIYIGSSKKNYNSIVDDKILRASPYYQFLPMGFVAGEKPITTTTAIDQQHQYGSSLLNLNIHQLLEPFMLITFLVFVLCLLDKAKVLTPISRLDLDTPQQAIEYEGYINYLKRNHTTDF